MPFPIFAAIPYTSFMTVSSPWRTATHLILVTAVVFSTLATRAQASEFIPLLLAQSSDDVYDPFVDYSEFEEVSQEEADINFFRNGRFLTLAFMSGYRTLTQTMGDLYSDSLVFGLYLSYFFDLRFALQASFLTGDHTLRFTSPQGQHVRGNIALSDMALNVKYYLNTQNITRSLAQLNPYFIGGFSQVTRTATVSGQTAFAKDGTIGFNIGGGVELPFMRDKMYFGFQALYQLVNFRDENTEIVLANSEATGIYPTGDALHAHAVLGVNF